MPLPEEIPAEIEITGEAESEISLEDFANFLRDLVLLHDRLWIIAVKDLSQYDITSGYFYTRRGRPIPKDQRLQLLSVRKGSPFSLVVELGVAGAAASVALPYFNLLRGGLLLRGELRRQHLDEKKIESEIVLNQLNAIKLASEVEEKHEEADRPTEVAKVVKTLTGHSRGLPKQDSTSFEEQQRIVTRDVERLTENEIVVTDVVVRRFRKTADHKVFDLNPKRKITLEK